MISEPLGNVICPLGHNSMRLPARPMFESKGPKKVISINSYSSQGTRNTSLCREDHLMSITLQADSMRSVTEVLNSMQKEIGELPRIHHPGGQHSKGSAEIVENSG